MILMEFGVMWQISVAVLYVSTSHEHLYSCFTSEHLDCFAGKRQKLEAAAAIAHPAPPAQGKLEFIADRVKQRRYSSVVNFAIHRGILLNILLSTSTSGVLCWT